MSVILNKEITVTYDIPMSDIPISEAKKRERSKFGFNKRHHFIVIPQILPDLRKEEDKLKTFALENDIVYNPIYYIGRGNMFYPFQYKYRYTEDGKSKEIFKTKVTKIHNGIVTHLNITNKEHFVIMCKSLSFFRIQFTFIPIVHDSFNSETKELTLVCILVTLHIKNDTVT